LLRSVQLYPLTLFVSLSQCAFVFCSNATSTVSIYTLSLHDALPIWITRQWPFLQRHGPCPWGFFARCSRRLFRLTGRKARFERRSEEHTSELQSREISYAVFCLKKKKLSTP